LGPWRIDKLPIEQSFAWPARHWRESIRDVDGRERGFILREQQAISGAVRVCARKSVDGPCVLSVQIENRTVRETAGDCTRDQAVACALVSTHAILQVEGGAFVSLIDPPPDCVSLAKQCHNVGAWPVLVGAEGSNDMMLAAPIILYDYPQVAPESPGDLFDGTEIDEILSLRIMTLSDEEKCQAAAVDERVRALLARTETLDRNQMAKLHGAMRKAVTP
jgi:hypothetical protein